MNPIRPNDAAIRHARELIDAGEINSDAAWNFTAEEAGELLGDPPDWDRFGGAFLCLRTGVSRKTKKAYVFPIGKDGKVYRSALLSARSRAAQDGQRQAFDTAGQLLAAIDGDPESGRANVAENMALVGDRPALCFALDAVDMDDLPEMLVQLLPFTGDDHVTAIDGRKLRVSEYSLEQIGKAFSDRINDIVLDYEHNTYNPFVPEGSRAAGWIREVFTAAPGQAIEDDVLSMKVDEYGPGVYARVSLTEAAAGKIKAKEYRYLSPVVRTNDEDTVLEIVGAAVTNDPALDGMMPLAAKKNTNKAADAAEAALNDPGRHREDTMEHLDFQTLTALIGRPVSNAADAQAAIEELRTAGAQNDQLSEELEQLRAENLAREAEVAVDAAIEEGRLDAKQRPWAIATFTNDRATWDGFIAATPAGTFTAKPTPPQDRLTPDPEDDDAGAGVNLGFRVVDGLTAFGKKVTVNKDELQVLSNATELANKHFNGDVARGIRATRR